MQHAGSPGPSGRRWSARVGLLLTIVALGVWLAPAGRAQPPTGLSKDTRSVMIKNFEFKPPRVTIAAGGIIRWINADVANHQISSGVVEEDRPRPDGRVSSSLLFRGDEFTATFGTPGEYPYYCGVHPFMRGTIVVK